MQCPACGFENIPGSDRCDECMEPLAELDLPQAQSGVQKRLMEDSITRLETSPPHSVFSGTSVAKALELMKEMNIGCILVVDEHQLVGIFSERDFLLKLAGLGKPLTDVVLREVMTPKPVTLEPGDTIRYALHLMSVGGFRHIPIVDNTRVLGILSIKHVLRYLNRSVLRSEIRKALLQQPSPGI
ncbi:MAG TPA: CBS domain-containing protein [Terriglobia bacterium]|nr:CBS domain-containing protein [Terriglobia bacterium]